MGCDIHMYLEQKTPTEPWGNPKEHHSMWNYVPAGLVIPPDPYWKDYAPHHRLFDDRIYALFALLADVRNYDERVPMAEPRGLPDDIDPWLKDRHDRGLDHIWLGDHSFSWLTLPELLSRDWTEFPSFQAALQAVQDYAAKVRAPIENFRVVFGFDS